MDQCRIVRIGSSYERLGRALGARGLAWNSRPAEYSYPAQVRAAVLAAMNAANASVADLARLNSLLGELYADAVLKRRNDSAG